MLLSLTTQKILLSFAIAILSSLPLRAEIVVGGARPVSVHVPPSYDPAVPTPLIILLHGYGYAGAPMESLFPLKPLADSKGFLYASPIGTPDPCGVPFWNATDASGRWACDGADIDDVSYLFGLVEEIQARLNVDSRRIHFTGWSNGGAMTYRMACEHPELIAAIASIDGMTFNDPAACQPETPVHVLHIHGTLDDGNLYGGGTRPNGVIYPGAVGTVERWATNNGCSLVAEDGGSRDLCRDFPGEETQVTRYTDGCNPGGSAELWTVVGAGHPACLGDAGFTQRVVDFLLSHPKQTIPQASFSIEPGNGPAPLEVTVDGSASATPVGTAVTLYQWDFGDGTMTETATPLANHKYTEPGRYALALTIRTNDDGRVARAKRTIAVSCASGDITPWSTADIGVPAFPGSSHFESDGTDSCLIACAGGKLLAGSLDQLHFDYQEIEGDFTFTAHIAEAEGPAADWQVGVMLRESIAPGARHAAMLLSKSTTGTRFRSVRREVESSASRGVTGDNATVPDAWVRMDRRGEEIVTSSSPDKMTWSELNRATFTGLPNTLLCGVVAMGSDLRPEEAFTPLMARVCNLEITFQADKVTFHRGDPNSSGTTDISDGIAIFGYLFLGNPPALSCKESADTNNSGAVDISDGIAILQYLFSDGPPPVAPGPPEDPCGLDPDPIGSAADLGCDSSYQPCG